MSNEYLCMKESKESFGQPRSEFLGIFNSDLMRLHTLYPFGTRGIEAVLQLGSMIYISSGCIGYKKDDTEIALIEAESGKVMIREHSFIRSHQIVHLPRNDMIAVFGDKSEVEFRDPNTLALIWTCRPRVVIEPSGNIKPVPNDLLLVWALRNMAAPKNELAEGPDGIVRMPFSSSQIMGIFEIDPAAREFRLVPFDLGRADQGLYGSFGSISPDSRWGIRECMDIRVEPYEKLQSEYGKWFLVTIISELWDLLARRKQALITAAPFPVLLHRPDETLAYYNWLKSGDRPRGPFGLFGRTRKQPPPGGKQYLDDQHRILIDGGWPTFFWEPDSKAVWLKRRFSMMRCELDGTTGPLIFPDFGLSDAQRAALQSRQSRIDFGRGEAYPYGDVFLIRSITKPRPDMVCFRFSGKVILELPLPYRQSDANGPNRYYPELTANDIESYLPSVVDVEGWTQHAVNAALADLASRLRSGLKNVMFGYVLALFFKLDGTLLDEWTFFEAMHEKGLVDVPVLRDLLTTWFDLLGGRMWDFICGDEARGAGPMSGALACLALNDDTCHDFLRRYCLSRDGEHEGYSRDTVLLGFISRRTVNDIDTLRLAVFFVFLCRLDGLFWMGDGKAVYPWGALGVFQAAAKLMEPEDFVKLVMDEVAQWDQLATATDAVIGGLVASLDLSEPWEARVHSALLTPPLTQMPETP